MPTESKSETPELLRVDCADGKYTVIQTEQGKLLALRYGDEWRDCVGDNLILALAQDLDNSKKELNEANEKLEQKDNEKDEEWLSAIAKAWNYQFIRPYETKDTTEANVCQVFQEIEDLMVSYNSIVTELDEVTEAISKFGYQDGTLVSMCERFKAYCDNQTRHLKEDTTAAVTSVKYLAKENKVMRDALKNLIPFASQYVSHPRRNPVDSWQLRMDEADACLKQPNTANLIVLTRDELIAEIEKMPCQCFDRSGNSGTDTGIIKCNRCKRIGELKSGK